MFLKATKRMWARRFRDAHYWVHTGSLTNKLRKAENNPATFLLTIILLVLDLVWVPLHTLMRFVANNVVFTFVSLTAITFVWLLISAHNESVPHTHSGSTKALEVTVEATNVVTTELVPEKVVEASKPKSLSRDSLATTEYIKDAMAKLPHHGCFEKELKHYVSNGWAVRVRNIDQWTRTCRERIRLGQDEFTIREQNAELAKVIK